MKVCGAMELPQRKDSKQSEREASPVDPGEEIENPLGSLVGDEDEEEEEEEQLEEPEEDEEEEPQEE